MVHIGLPISIIGLYSSMYRIARARFGRLVDARGAVVHAGRHGGRTPHAPPAGRGPQAPQHLPRNDHPLDLAGTLVDLEDLGVAEQLLYRVLLVVAVSTEEVLALQEDAWLQDDIQVKVY